MYRQILFAAAGVALLAGPALAGDDLPAELQRRVDPVTTSSVPAAAPAFLRAKVFVHPGEESNDLPVELQQQVDPVTTSSVPATAPAHLSGKVFVQSSEEPNQLPVELR